MVESRLFACVSSHSDFAGTAEPQRVLVSDVAG